MYRPMSPVALLVFLSLADTEVRVVCVASVVKDWDVHRTWSIGSEELAVLVRLLAKSIVSAWGGVAHSADRAKHSGSERRKAGDIVGYRVSK